MRVLPFRRNSFDLVVNLFTSFGYFTDDAQHLSVLQGVADVLVHRGKLVLDYLNADRVKATLVAHQEIEVGSQRVAIERKLLDDGRYVLKEMHLVDDGQSFLERVRLFSGDDLAALMDRAGLEVTQRFGNYAGDELNSISPRAILVAERR